MKINKSKIRRDISASLYEKFISSGVEYTCFAAVNGYLRPFALLDAKKLLGLGINLSKSNYPFAYVGLMADMFCTDVCKIVHDDFLKSRRL
jgi:hypothetical protein